MNERREDAARRSGRSAWQTIYQRLRELPVVFAAVVAGGAIAGTTALLYAASGIVGRSIYAWAAGLPNSRLIVGAGGALILLTIAGILTRRLFGLFAYCASAVYIGAVLPLVLMCTRQHVRLDMLLVHLALTAALLAYGWLNRNWFYAGPETHGIHRH